MSLDVWILVAITLCQAATGYWAFHMSVNNNAVRWGFATVTVIGVVLIVWSGIRNGQSSDAINDDLSAMRTQLTRIANATDVNPNQSSDALAEKIIDKFNDLQTQINQTKANVQTLQNPPLDPSTLYQNGKPVANVISATPSADESGVIFGELDNVSIDFSQQVFFRGYTLQCKAQPGDFMFGNSPTTGKAAEDVYTNVFCSILAAPK